MYVIWSETQIRSQYGYYTLDLLRHISSHNYTKHLICYPLTLWLVSVFIINTVIIINKVSNY